jgi:rhodanese-related sulfurtransferase
MTVNEYSAWRRDKTPHFLLDVRQPEEYEAARLEGSVLIPLSELPGRLAELPKGLPLVVLCHHGMRSAHAVHHLREAGFDALNLSVRISAKSITVTVEADHPVGPSRSGRSDAGLFLV